MVIAYQHVAAIETKRKSGPQVKTDPRIQALSQAVLAVNRYKELDRSAIASSDTKLGALIAAALPATDVVDTYISKLSAIVDAELDEITKLALPEVPPCVVKLDATQGHSAEDVQNILHETQTPAAKRLMKVWGKSEWLCLGLAQFVPTGSTYDHEAKFALTANIRTAVASQYLCNAVLAPFKEERERAAHVKSMLQHKVEKLQVTLAPKLELSVMAALNPVPPAAAAAPVAAASASGAK